jgi:hypothetical protein
VTDQNKLYRWSEHQSVCKEIAIPDRIEDEKTRETVIGMPGGFLHKVNAVMKKMPFGEEKQMNDYQITRIFMDKLGNHCLMTSDSGDAIYLNLLADTAKYMLRLKGKRITAVYWDDNTSADSTRVKRFDGHSRNI